MATFENTVVIHRNRPDVFEYLADFENIPQWNYAIVETKKTSSGRVGVGSTYRQVRSVPQHSEEEFAVTDFHPDDRLAIDGRIGPFHAQMTYVLEGVADGTRLTNTVELEPATTLTRMVAPLAIPQVKTAVARNLDQLKQVLEAGA